MALEIDLTLMILLVIVGIGVASITSMVGLGGGIIFVPVLLLIFQFPAKNVIPISLLAMTGNTISCSIAYIRQRRINYKLVFLYDVLDPVGIYVGAWLVTALLSEDMLIGIVSGIILILGITLIRKAKASPPKRITSLDGTCAPVMGEQSDNGQPVGDLKENTSLPVYNAKDVKIKNIPAALVSSFGSGFVSGLAGVGGGITDTTSMILLGVPPHIAAPTSELAMAFTNIMAVITYTLMGNIVWEASIPLMCGAIIGGQIGAHYSKRIKSHILIYILVGFALFAAIRLIISVLTGF